MANTRCVRVTEEQYQWVVKNRKGKDLPPAKQAKADAQIVGIKKEKDDYKEKYEKSVKLIAELESRLGTVGSMKEMFAGAKTDPIIKASGKSNEATACLIASDWHLEENIDPRKVEGVNDFTVKVARERVTKFVQDGLSIIEMARHRHSIETLVFAQLGDVISGYIHEELMEGNELSPSEAILEGYTLMCECIDFLLEHGNFGKMIIVCKFGNHGRTTQKMRVQTAAENSFEWLMYQFLRQNYRHEKRIEWRIGKGYFDYVKAYDTTMRFHHGDAIRYKDGVGGLTIPLHKAINQWNTMKPADLDVLGHWHQSIFQKRFVVNGSVVGYGPYSVQIKAPFELAAQTVFLVEPGIGKTLESPIIVQSAT